MSGVRIDVEARTSKAEQDLANINQSLRNIEKTTASTGASLKNMFSSLATLATAGLAVNYIKNVSSEFTNLSNKIALVTGRTKELARTQEALFQIAEDTRGSLQGTVTTFASFGRALKETGASTERILTATKSVQQAIAISGSSAESAAAALVQLGQGISSGTLRGEELNSVLEQTPRIAQAIADELNVTTGRLRLIAADGKLTSDVVFGALLNQAKAINKEFETLAPTLTQANSLLSDSIRIYVSELDKGLGFSDAIGLSTFNLAKRIKQASKDAFELGTSIAFTYNRITGGLKLLGAPLLGIFQELGKQFLQILPTVSLSRTLKRDFQEATMAVDQFSGGLLTRFNRFKFINLITIESDVEKAIRQLKRLSPTYWAGAGFNRATFERIFSTQYLLEVVGAFQDLYSAIAANTNAIGGVLTKFFRSVDTGFKNLSRYFGFRLDTLFVFTRGNLENFLGTLTDIVRGVSGASIKFFELGKIAEYYLAPSIKGLTTALKDAIPSLITTIGNAVIASLKAVLEFIKIIATVIYEFNTSFSIKAVLEDSYKSVIKFFDGLRKKADLEDVIDSIRDFGKKVIRVFFEIYDAVIGNSWWTDTVDSVINTSNTLWDKASSGLNKFKTNTINIFKNVFDSRRRLNFDFSDIKSIDFSFTSFKLPKLTTRDWADSIVGFAEKFKEVFKDTIEAFPNIAKFALVGAAGLLVSALFPAGVIKNVLLAAIVTSLVTSSTLIAEQFGAALTGGSFVSEVGYQLGRAAGFFVNTLITELPQFLNALLGIVSSFVRGFTEQLPFIGGLIKSIFNVGDFVGISGPLGIVGAFLFGGLAAKTLKTLGIGKDAIEGIEGIFGKIGAIVTGKDDGIISKYLFGKFGSARTLSVIGLLLNSLGAFDAIFSNSVLAQYAVQGGLIYTTLFGQAGVNKITDAVGSKIIAPISDALKSSAKAATANTSLYDIFFGATGTWADRASVALKSVIDKISGKIVDAATPFVEKGFDFVKTLLLGTKPEVTATAVKKQVAAVAASAVIQLEILKQKLSSLDLGSFFGGFGGRGASKVSDAVKQASATVVGEAGKLSGIAGRIGGETGLLGRLFFGRAGKVALVAGILTVFATAASASEKTASALREQSVFQDIVDNWNKLKLENPIAAVALQILGVSIPLIIGGLIFFRAQVATLIGSAFNVSAIKTWATTTVSSIGTVAKSLKNVGIIGGAGALAGGLTYGLTQDVGIAIAAATFAAELALIFRKKIAAALVSAFQFVFVKLGGAILGFVFSIKGAIILLLTGAITAFVDWFFGLDLASRVKNTVNRIKSSLGFKTEETSKTTGLSAESEKFARSRNLGLSYSIEDINFGNISKTDRERLEKAVGKLEETIKQSIDEEETTGRVSQDTRDSIKALDKSLNNLIPRIEARSAFNTADFAKQLQDLRNLTPESPAQRIATGARQLGLDIAFGINERLLKARQTFATTREGRLSATEDLDRLRAERGTRFSARFRPLDATAEDIAKLASKVKDLEAPDADLAKQIGILQQKYLQAFKAVADAETSIFGGFKPLAPTDQRVVLRDLLGEQLRNSFLKQIGIDQANKDIKEFQGRLTTVASNLKGIGIDFKTDELFAIDDESFKGIERLSRNAKDLAEQLKNTKTVAEQNQIIYRITEIRTQILEFKLRSEEGGPNRKQFLLKQRLEQAGIGIFNENTLKGLSDDASENLFKLANDVVLLEDQLKRKLPGPMQSLKPGDDSWLDSFRRSLGGKAVSKEQQEAIDNYEEGRKRLQSKIKELRDGVIASAKNASTTAIPVLQDLAGSLGLDFNEIVKTKGFDKASAGINQLLSLNDKLQTAIQNNSRGQVQSITKQIEFLKEDLQEAPKTLQDLISAISGLGRSFALEDLGLLKPDQFKELQDVGGTLNAIDKTIRRLGPTASKVQIDAILTRKLNASRKAFEIYLQTLYSTGEKTLEGLSRVGLSDAFEISLFSEAQLKQFLSIDTQILKIKEQLKDPANSERFGEILENLANATRQAEKLKKSLGNFDVRLEAINKAFGLNLTESEAARLSQSLLIELSAEAQTALDNIADLKKLPLFAKAPVATQQNVTSTAPAETDVTTLDGITITGRAFSAIAELSKAFDALRNKSNLVAKRSEILAVKTQESVAELALMPLDTLVSKITDAFPALGDFKDTLGRLTRTQLDALGLLAIDVEATRRRVNLGLATPAELAAAQRKGTTEGQGAIEGISFGAGLTSRLKTVGIDFEKEAFNLVSTANKNVIENLTTQLETAIANRDLVLATPGATDASRIAAQNLVNDQRELLSNAIIGATVDIRKITRDAGKEFASSITSSWTSALTEYIGGKTTWKEFTNSILTTFTDQVIKTFVEGLMQPFTGENGFITTSLRSLGSNIFSAFKGGKDQTGMSLSQATPEGGEGGILDGLSTIFAPLTGFFGSILTGIGNLFGVTVTQVSAAELEKAYYGGWFSAINATLVTLLGTINTTLGAILARVSLDNPAFATGGLVSGPGSGTSDSILARISNGEYVINAESSRKFRPLLDAINSDKLKSFASGGLVASSLMTAPAMADIKAVKGSQESSSQVINISITGDISRQTRSEIYKMLPSIAEGVNLHNKEKGNRG
jgi:tape measure domain-containing protein